MEATQEIHFDKKLGVITANELVLKHKTRKNNIPLQSIKDVKLVKYRVIYTNLFLFLLSCMLLVIPGLVLEVEYGKFVAFTLLGIFLLIASFVHKFYHYRLVVEDDEKTKHTVRASQLHRKSIKHFYYLLTNKVPKNVN